MNPTDPSPKKSKSRKPKQPSTPSEPAAPAASKSVAPWELTAQMTEEQIDSFADELVKLHRAKKAQAANPPASSSAAEKPKMTDEELRAALLSTKPRRENFRSEEEFEEAWNYWMSRQGRSPVLRSKGSPPMSSDDKPPSCEPATDPEPPR